jgi:hypothetical protein
MKFDISFVPPPLKNHERNAELPKPLTRTCVSLPRRKPSDRWTGIKPYEVRCCRIRASPRRMCALAGSPDSGQIWGLEAPRQCLGTSEAFGGRWLCTLSRPWPKCSDHPRLTTPRRRRADGFDGYATDLLAGLLFAPTSGATSSRGSRAGWRVNE